MRFTLSQDPARHLDPRTVHNLGYALAAATVGAIMAVVLVLAISRPATAVGVGVLAVAGWLAVRTLRRFYRIRQHHGLTRQVCVPKIDACIEL